MGYLLVGDALCAAPTAIVSLRRQRCLPLFQLHRERLFAKISYDFSVKRSKKNIRNQYF